MQRVLAVAERFKLAVKGFHVAKQAPAKSRTPFFALIAVVLAVGASFIYYKTLASKAVPITLAPGTPLPKAEGYLRGNPDAPITILEFADFECPGCGQFANVTEPDVRSRIVDAGLANIRYFDFPLINRHANTMAASLAAACANDQNKFWEMHDMLFAGQAEWRQETTTNPKKVFAEYVSKLGLDAPAWNQCFDSQKHVGRIEANRNEGISRMVNSTPTFIIGDQAYADVLTYDQLKGIIDSLTKARAAPPFKK